LAVVRESFLSSLCLLISVSFLAQQRMKEKVALINRKLKDTSQR